MFLFSGLADRSPLTVGYPKLASTPPPCLPSLADEGEVPFCRQTRRRSPSDWAVWADWLAQAVTNRISSVLSNFGSPADEAK